MLKYKVAKGSRLAHSTSALGGAGQPPATSGKVYEAGEELELPEVEGTRLVEAGVLVAPQVGQRQPVRKRRKK